jgi:hypothetical protein
MNDPRILSDFEKSLRQLEKALTVSTNDDLIKAGCLQYDEALKAYASLGSFLPELQELSKSLSRC